MRWAAYESHAFLFVFISDFGVLSECFFSMAKPFVKWAGGKGRLLSVLEKHLPPNILVQQEISYIEPFVGGGAMLFFMLDRFPNIRRAIINDLNPALMSCYSVVKNQHEALIWELKEIENSYCQLITHDERRSLYNSYRDEYNSVTPQRRRSIRNAALFIFFNRTCFNGLYRENKNGGFNVPYGKYSHPTICNEQTIVDAHFALQNVEILNGNYDKVLDHINWKEYNLFYIDPPYRPMLGGKNFRQYTSINFDDSEQEKLKQFCDSVNRNGGYFMLSNSDSESQPGVSFFDELYKDYNVMHIRAPRTINALGSGRCPAAEIISKNY